MSFASNGHGGFKSQQEFDKWVGIFNVERIASVVQNSYIDIEKATENTRFEIRFHYMGNFFTRIENYYKCYVETVLLKKYDETKILQTTNSIRQNGLFLLLTVSHLLDHR